jgi:hypothetical protein
MRGGLDPNHVRLDHRLFRSDKRHFRPNQQRGGLEMRGVESYARESWSAKHDVGLNERRVRSDAQGFRSDAQGFQSDAQGFQSDAQGFQSDVPEVQSDVSQVESDELRVRLK